LGVNRKTESKGPKSFLLFYKTEISVVRQLQLKFSDIL